MSPAAPFAPSLPPYRKLTDAQLARLHAASLEILERVGAYLHDEEALALLKKAGVPATDGNRVHIPARLVEWALALAPRSITLYDRRGDPVMPLEGYHVFYGPGSDCLNVIDLDTGLPRPATLRDVADGVRLCDALKNIDFIMSWCIASDVDQRLVGQFQMREMLRNSTKPSIFVTPDFESMVDVIAMAEVVAGGAEALRQKPITACYINVTGPLRHNQESLQKLLYLAEKGLPTTYIPVVLRGLNGPVTRAGALALANAGEMVGVVLAQLKREGAPLIISGGTSDTVDMRTLVGSYAAPENRALFMEMAHYHGLPMFGLGGASDSKLPDEQAAAEAALTLLTETLAGTHLVHDVGYLASGLTASYEQMVLCNELIAWVKRFAQPVEVSDETLALDLIFENGADGQYLNTPHTGEHFRQDWYSRLFDRQNIADWEKAGSTTLHQRAVAQARKLLAEHQAEPLPADTLAALDRILETGRRRGNT
ncbi:MAG: trimethylamine methyltransferase family protein [Anaerolineae bacterium]|nr:trimethylamine methyltransferase family protein [Anaerolineae bacterium]